MGRSAANPAEDGEVTCRRQSRRPATPSLGNTRKETGRSATAPHGDLGFVGQKIEAFARGVQAVRLDSGGVVADGDLQVDAGLGIDGGDGRIGGQFGFRAEVDLHGIHQPDGRRPEQLQAGAAEQEAVGFKRQVGPIAVQRFGGVVTV